MEKEINNRKRGLIFLLLALLAFAGLGLEILILIVEATIYDIDLNDFSKNQLMIHWLIACFVWIIVAIVLLYFGKKKQNFDLFKNKKNVKGLNWLLCGLILIISVIISIIDWEGFKVFKEFNYHGMRNFVFQYIYYLIEAVLVYIILAFSQEAGEVLFNKEYIPYGGVFVGLTWGLVHVLTQGSLEAGLLSILVSIFFGVVYLLSKKNSFIAFPFVLLILIL